ncbi:MAG: superoxide dismutase family protein [Micavibrio sp.]|nr:superoxide dismutase family protein [Micavibrio sp.]
MKKYLPIAAAALLVCSTAAFVTPAERAEDAVAEKMAAPATLDITLVNNSGADAGTAKITGAPKGVLFSLSLSGLTPGWHGVHIHGMGNCMDHDHFKNAGGHMMKEGQKHGFLNAAGPHDGDLPNVWIASDGTGKAEFYTAAIMLDALKDKDGSALMVHAGADDYMTDPAGASGDRVACGVISAAETDAPKK